MGGGKGGGEGGGESGGESGDREGGGEESTVSSRPGTLDLCRGKLGVRCALARTLLTPTAF